MIPPLCRAIEDQAEVWSKLKEHVKAELGMHAAAGRSFIGQVFLLVGTFARDPNSIFHS